MKRTEYPGVYTDDGGLFTENLVPGVAVYGERLVKEGGSEFRSWNPRRSKLAALLLTGIKGFLLDASSRVLYLGAGAGTTISHVSDIAANGSVYGVEMAPKAFQKLLVLSEQRRNLVPILSDARRPELYRRLVGEVDVLYQDVAQREQARIYVKNARHYAPKSAGILMVKARSVDVATHPSRIYRREAGVLQEEGFQVSAIVPLDPYQRDHVALLVRRR